MGPGRRVDRRFGWGLALAAACAFAVDPSPVPSASPRPSTGASGPSSETPGFDSELEAARSLVREKKYAAAAATAEALRPRIESAEGPDSLHVADALYLLAQARFLDTRAADAQQLEMAQSALRIREVRLGPDDPKVADSLTLLGGILMIRSDFVGAEPILERAVRIREKALGPEHQDTGVAVKMLGQAVARKGDYRAARGVLERACGILERALGPDHEDLGACLNDLGIDLWLLGDYPASAKVYERALAVREKSLGADSDWTVTTLGNLGIVVREMGDYPRAKAIQERVLEIRERKLGPDHPWVSNALESLANILLIMGDYASAKPLYERAVAIREKAYGEDHIDTAEVLSNYGSFLVALGDYPGAKAYYERALRIRQKVTKPDSPLVAESEVHIATVDQAMGDYAGARSYGERALAAFEASVGPEHPKVAEALLRLCEFHAETGDVAEAAADARRALSIREKVLGPKHPEVAEALETVATLTAAAGDTKAARPLLDRAMAIKLEAFGPEHAGVGKTLIRLGRVLEESADLPGARDAYERALAILEKTYGGDHPELSEVLRRLGRLRLAQGDVDGAAAPLDRALAIREKWLGSEHPLTAESKVDVGALRWAAGASPEAVLDLALGAESTARASFRRTAGALTESEALRYEATRASGLDVALTAVASFTAGRSAAPASRAFDQVVRSRALVLDEMAARRRSILESADPSVNALLQALTVARNRLARLAVEGPDPKRPGGYRAKLEKASADREQAERALAETSIAFRGRRAGWEVGSEQVRKSIPPGTALVSYVEFTKLARPATGKAQRCYLAFVLSPGSREPRVVPLGRASEIESLVRGVLEQASVRPSSLAAAARDAESRFREAAEPLRRRVWDPVAAVVKGAKQALIVPDGSLHLLSFGILPTAEGRYLAESGPVLHYVSAERDLARGPGTRPRGRGLVALGGPAYDESPAAADGATSAPGDAIRDAAGSGLRGAQVACRTLASLRFEPIQASRLEAEELAALWADASTDDAARVLTLTGRAAGEAAFKKAAPGRRVLHLATHGFFAGEGCESALAQAQRNAGAEAVVGDDPLLLSGLAFTGANLRGRAAGDADSGADGILTAEEIASLDLSGVEWAVLSACETGVGKIQAGEGVLGLRRAFETAGAATLILSLWSVEDEATRAWMRELYRARLAGGSSAASVRRATTARIDALRDAGLPAHPFWWGAFVAAGDWR